MELRNDAAYTAYPLADGDYPDIPSDALLDARLHFPGAGLPCLIAWDDVMNVVTVSNGDVSATGSFDANDIALLRDSRGRKLGTLLRGAGRVSTFVVGYGLLPFLPAVCTFPALVGIRAVGDAGEMRHGTVTLKGENGIRIELSGSVITFHAIGSRDDVRRGIKRLHIRQGPTCGLVVESGGIGSPFSLGDLCGQRTDFSEADMGGPCDEAVVVEPPPPFVCPPAHADIILEGSRVQLQGIGSGVVAVPVTSVGVAAPPPLPTLPALDAQGLRFNLRGRMQ